MAKADVPDFPTLPEDSVLDLADYLSMQRAVAHETRYRVLATLLREGDLSASELAAGLDEPSNRLHYHLDELLEAGLVANRKRRDRGADGLYSYYAATALGEAIMTEGVAELLAEERDLLDRYA